MAAHMGTGVRYFLLEGRGGTSIKKFKCSGFCPIFLKRSDIFFFWRKIEFHRIATNSEEDGSFSLPLTMYGSFLSSCFFSSFHHCKFSGKQASNMRSRATIFARILAAISLLWLPPRCSAEISTAMYRKSVALTDPGW